MSADGMTTVILRRPVAGLTTEHYSLPTKAGAVSVIVATGTGPQLAYHGATRTGTEMVLLPSFVESCLCQPEAVGYIRYMNTSQRAYHVDCEPEPRGDMLAQNNAACHMESYHGGLQCCQHTWLLTDAEDDAKVPPQVDTYYLKWRYYFQEFHEATPTSPASHLHLHHWVFLIDAQVNDYEEAPCKPGDSCIGTITAHLPASHMGLEDIPKNFSGITPLVMTPHCHAPSCINEELWNADTGELICNVTARYGHGTDKFDELDYITLSPCLWGHQDGIPAPIVIPPTANLRAVKHFNTTYRHLGQMAQWTGLMVYQP